MSGLPSPTVLGARVVYRGLRAVDGALENAALGVEAIHRSFAPLPDVTEDYDESKPEGLVATGIEGLRAQVKRGLPVTANPIKATEALVDIAGTKAGLTEGLDDRKLALEYLLTFLSRADPAITTPIEHGAIRTLYYDLPHPPSTQMGQDYQFRSADGSGNSPLNPNIGKAGTPYSRSCTGLRPLPVADLPEAGLVYDALIKRNETKFKEHPAGLSGLFFNYATSVIHSVFRTSRIDWNINETSSYVDLGMLYGNTQAHQDKIRYVDGRGKILPDVFAETRLLNLPPAVVALLIVFNRNHNYIADLLLRINERGTWEQDLSKIQEPEPPYSGTPEVIKDPATQAAAPRKSAKRKILEKQDHEIFNTARLINSATYASVVLGDYLSAILGTVRDGSSWTLNIQGERRESDHRLLERGQGNSCSVEFNVLYRLHPSMSKEDADYAGERFSWLFYGGKTPPNWDELTPDIFEQTLGALQLQVLYKSFKKEDGSDAKATPPALDSLTEPQLNDVINDGKPVDYLLDLFTFRGFKDADGKWDVNPRDPDTKKYKDELLARALVSATSVPAHAFQARGVPGVMRVIEILGIEQARNWGSCSLNEFRKFLGLKPYATFEEWNPDKSVADAAKKLYRTTDNLELYVGLVSEESKKVMDGAGLCPSYTMSRAILADAVALVRGDRYLTYDFTPFNLTTWGFFDGARNVKNASWGGVLGKLFARTLPRHFNSTSVYTHFPLIRPTGHRFSMDKILAKLGQAKEYTFTPPPPIGETYLISDPNAIYDGLGDADHVTEGLITLYGQRIKNVGLSPSYLTVIDDPRSWEKVTKLVQEVFVPDRELADNGKWFYNKTIELIGQKSYTVLEKGGPKYVDIVKEVLRLVPVHWVSLRVAGLPVKTAFQPHGLYYEQQIYQMLKEIHSYIFIEGDATLEIPAQREARANVVRLRRFVKLSLVEAKGSLPVSLINGLAGWFLGDVPQFTNRVLKRLLGLGAPLDEVANDIIGVISSASIELSQIFTHVINFYLPPVDKNAADYASKQDLYEKIVLLASKGSDPLVLATLEGYVREALRLDPVIEGVCRVVTKDIPVGPLASKAGDRLYFDFGKVGKDESAFSNPENISPEDVEPQRPLSDYAHYHGDTVFKSLGPAFVTRVAAEVLRAVFSKPNISRTKGVAGTLRRYREPVITVDDKVSIKNQKLVRYQKVDEDGELVDTDWYETVNEYKLTPGDPTEAADRWSYLDPEIGHQPSPWATGLTLTYGA
ncbi:heme peroxidase [Cantharellus anzutake]|uniref:heme peroxidase n=1 Tax=Cantharellus anzutake TaxID=1750568 RepID=UPI001908F94B|nr:heme peroxidase [Cantharellus anzutake]KAF8337113.1 heme peroxidase [Cantharellus anzutake]